MKPFSLAIEAVGVYSKLKISLVVTPLDSFCLVKRIGFCGESSIFKSAKSIKYEPDVVLYS